MKKCLVCEKDLPADKWGVIHGATSWTSSGTYGSTVYDPINEDRYLEAYVCDECLLKRKSILEEVFFIEKVEELERKEPNFEEI